MRSYRDPCGIARALDLVGERWALLVVRELMLGPKRFTDLRAGLPQLSPDVLAQRLRELEQAGVVSRRKLAPPAGARVYELTERGRELEAVVIQLGRWGSSAPFPAEHGELSADALMIALKTTFDPAAAAGLDARVRAAARRGPLPRPHQRRRADPGPRGRRQPRRRRSRPIPPRSQSCCGTAGRSTTRCGPDSSGSRAAAGR